MIDTTLVVLAAGIGSRYGAGVKQLERVGVCGEIIVDYSIYDAIKAGFNKVVFIIRHDIEQDFREIIGNRISKIVPVEYVYQELSDIPEDLAVPAERKKPWGTGHAVLGCASVVKEPFAVINADDFYGAHAFKLIHDYLVQQAGKEGAYCMAGYIMENTLSRHGTVTRGICNANGEDMLESVIETYNLHLVGHKVEGTAADGYGVCVEPDAMVSMNMWGFTPDFFDILESGFDKFIREVTGASNSEQRIKSEYLLPVIIGDLLEDKRVTVKMLRTEDEWFGITYLEDKREVIETIRSITEAGLYPAPLFR